MLEMKKYDLFGDGGDSQDKLGVSRRIQARFYQNGLTVGDLLLMSPNAHGSWKSYYLSNSHTIPVHQLKRRLHNQMIQDFSVVILKTQEGSGRIHKGVWDQMDELQGVDSNKSDGIEEELDHSTPQETKINSEIPNQKSELSKDNIDFSESVDSTITADSHRAFSLSSEDSMLISEGKTESNIQSDENQFFHKKTTKNQSRLLRILARIWMRGKTLRAKSHLFITRLQRKIVPNKNAFFESSFRLQSIAIVLVPVLLIIGSLYIYSSYGKDEQYNFFMNSAVEKSLIADQTNSSTEKKLWEEVLIRLLRRKNIVSQMNPASYSSKHKQSLTEWT